MRNGLFASAVAAGVAATAVAFAGCGSDDAPSTVTVTQTVESGDPAPPAADPARSAEAAVAGHGFQQVGRTAYYGVVLENRSERLEAQDVRVVVRALNRRGKRVASDSKQLGAVPPGTTFNVGGTIALDRRDRVEEIEVVVRTGGSGPPALRLPRVVGVRVEREDYGGLRVTGEVENVLDHTLSTAADVFAVFRDGQGQIVGGASTALVHDVPPGARAPVELTVEADLTDAVKAEVTVDNEPPP